MPTTLPRAFALLSITLASAAAPVEAQVRTRPPVREIDSLPKATTAAAPTSATVAKRNPTANTPTTALRGRYRVVLAGGRVNNSTFDNTFNLDGVRDEIFFTTDVQMVDKTGGTVLPFSTLSDRTKIYGDKGRDPEQRVKAGTAWVNGGLRAGDHFPAEGPFNQKLAFVDRQLPLRLWEGELVQGQNAVIITPMIWEYDGTAIADLTAQRTNFARDFKTKLADSQTVDKLVAGTGGGIAGMIIDAAPLAPTLSAKIISIFGRDGDRPIGATVEGDKVVYKPQPIVLNYDRIEQFLESGVQVGNIPKGYYPLAFREPMSHKLEGDYTLYIHIQRVP